MESVVKCKKICKTIKKHKILKDISFEIKRGEIAGVIGRNGSGKSMLFKTICGLVKPTSGNVEVFGEDITSKGLFPRDLGALIEYPGFLGQFSGFKNLKMLAEIQNKINDEDIRNALDTVGLDPYDKRHYRKYSLGMRQKLGLASSIMEKPKLIVLDEPTNNLDLESVNEFRELILKLKEEGVTILLASHNKEDIEMCCDRVFSIVKGELKEEKEFDRSEI